VRFVMMTPLKTLVLLAERLGDSEMWGKQGV
jgi:hypothetical protein